MPVITCDATWACFAKTSLITNWLSITELTGRCFKTRKKEHIRNVKTCANGSNTAKHARSFDHRIDFDNSSVINKGSFHIRKTLEAWHTSATKHADNSSKPIPNQYSILFKQWSPNLHIFTLLLFFLFLFCLFLHIFYHFAFHFYLSKAVDWQLKAHVLFWNFLASEHFYLNFELKFVCIYIVFSYQYSNWISLICLFTLCSGHFRCLVKNLKVIKNWLQWNVL